MAIKILPKFEVQGYVCVCVPCVFVCMHACVSLSIWMWLCWWCWQWVSVGCGGWEPAGHLARLDQTSRHFHPSFLLFCVSDTSLLVSSIYRMISDFPTAAFLQFSACAVCVCACVCGVVTDSSLFVFYFLHTNALAWRRHVTWLDVDKMPVWRS